MKPVIILVSILVLTACKQTKEQQPSPLPQPGREKMEKEIVIQLRAGGKVFAGDHEWKGNPDSTLREAIRIFKLDNNDPIAVLMQVDSVVAYGFVHRMMKAANAENAKVRANILQRN